MSVHAESTSAARPKARKAVHPADVQHATDAGLDLLRVIGRLVLHNVTLPGRPDLAIDHVVAGPSGVYVINTIAPHGSVSISGNILLCAGTSMMDEVREVAGSAAVLRELLSGAPVAPILCFQRNAEVAGVVGEVAVCSTENILELLSVQPDVLDAAGQRDVMRILSDTLVQAVRREQRFEPESSPKPRHRHKGWSLRRGVSAAPPLEKAAPPQAAAAPPAEKQVEARPEPVALAAVPELVPASVVEPVVEPVLEPVAPVVAAAPVLELPADVLERVVELVSDPVADDADVAEVVVDDTADVVGRPVVRAPVRPPARAAARAAARPAARPPARPARVSALQEPAPQEPEVHEPGPQELVAEAPVVKEILVEEPMIEAPVGEAPVGEAPVGEAPVVEELVVADDEAASRPVWHNAAPERVVAVEAADPDELPTSEPRSRIPRVDVRPVLRRVGGLLARLAPDEPVESVSALRAIGPEIAKAPTIPKPRRTPRETSRTAAPEMPRETSTPLPSWSAAPPPRALAPVTTPVEETPKRRLSVLVPTVVAALIVAAVIMVSPQVPAALAWGKGFFVEPPTPAVGTLIAVGSSALEPPYDVTASAPVPVKTTPAGTTVRNGDRLVAIQFRVANTGTTKLVLPVGARLEAVDALGIGYSPTSTVAKTNLGATLPKTLNVGPGAILNGSVVFSLPKGRTVEQIRLRLPDPQDGSVAWNVR